MLIWTVLAIVLIGALLYVLWYRRHQQQRARADGSGSHQTMLAQLTNDDDAAAAYAYAQREAAAAMAAEAAGAAGGAAGASRDGRGAYMTDDQMTAMQNNADLNAYAANRLQEVDPRAASMRDNPAGMANVDSALEMAWRKEQAEINERARVASRSQEKQREGASMDRDALLAMPGAQAAAMAERPDPAAAFAMGNQNGGDPSLMFAHRKKRAATPAGMGGQGTPGFPQPSASEAMMRSGSSAAALDESQFMGNNAAFNTFDTGNGAEDPFRAATLASANFPGQSLANMALKPPTM